MVPPARCTSRRRASIAGLVAALALLATACLPPFQGPPSGPKAVLYGDSLLFTTDYNGALGPWFDLRGWQRSVVSGIGVGVGDHRALIDLAPGSGARAVVLTHGTTETNRAVDAGAGGATAMDRSVSALVSAVDALSPVPCVILVTVNQHGGTPTFNQLASRYNWAILALDLSRPNVRVLDWSGRSFGHPEWFAGDGVHLTMAGDWAHAEALAGAVAAC